MWVADTVLTFLLCRFLTLDCFQKSFPVLDFFPLRIAHCCPYFFFFMCCFVFYFFSHLELSTSMVCGLTLEWEKLSVVFTSTSLMIFRFFSSWSTRVTPTVALSRLSDALLCVCFPHHLCLCHLCFSGREIPVEVCSSLQIISSAVFISYPRH